VQTGKTLSDKGEKKEIRGKKTGEKKEKWGKL